MIAWIVYGLSAISLVLAAGGLAAYAQSKHIGLLISSIISIVCALLAIAFVSFWPLAVGFSLNWGLRLLGLDPGYRA
jgi:uncharacterized membrane protein YesL